MIKIRQLSFGYQKDRPILQDISLDFDEGKVHGILGMNGAGKTSFFKALTGSLPYDGNILFNEKGQSDFLATQRNQISSYLGQEPTYDFLTGREYLKSQINLRGLDDEAFRFAMDLAKRLRFDKWLDTRISNDSLGSLCKIELTSQILCGGNYLILDEPTNSLDAHSIISLRHILEQLRLEGKTVLVSSHNLDFLNKTCDTFAFLGDNSVKLIINTEDFDLEQEYLKRTPGV